LATNFVVYRVGLWWIGWHRPCGCLGNLTDLLGISPHTADTIMKLVLAYLLAGTLLASVGQSASLACGGALGATGRSVWQWRQSLKENRKLDKQVAQGGSMLNVAFGYVIWLHTVMFSMFQFVGQSKMRAEWFSIEASVSGQREKSPRIARGEFPGKPAWCVAMAIVNLALFSLE